MLLILSTHFFIEGWEQHCKFTTLELESLLYDLCGSGISIHSISYIM